MVLLSDRNTYQPSHRAVSDRNRQPLRVSHCPDGNKSSETPAHPGVRLNRDLQYCRLSDACRDGPQMTSLAAGKIIGHKAAHPHSAGILALLRLSLILYL